MEILPKLTPTQVLLLRAAARRADGRVIPPANLRRSIRFSALIGDRKGPSTSSAFQGQFNSRNRNRTRVP
jgi:hypothetical protein